MQRKNECRRGDNTYSNATDGWWCICNYNNNAETKQEEDCGEYTYIICILLWVRIEMCIHGLWESCPSCWSDTIIYHHCFSFAYCMTTRPVRGDTIIDCAEGKKTYDSLLRGVNRCAWRLYVAPYRALVLIGAWINIREKAPRPVGECGTCFLIFLRLALYRYL